MAQQNPVFDELLKIILAKVIQYSDVLDPHIELLQKWHRFVKKYFTATHKKRSDEFGIDQELLAKLRPALDFLYYNYWRIEVVGLNHVPKNGRGLIVANHSGTLPWDGAMINMAIFNEQKKKRNTRVLVDDFVFNFPLLGDVLTRVGGVRASHENATRLLDKNNLVAVFPEGVNGVGKLYRDRYKLQRFARGGYIKLAIRTKSPIIPCAVIGAEEIHPILKKMESFPKAFGLPYIPITPTFPWLGILGFIPLPSKWYIYFGRPINTNKYARHLADDEKFIDKLNARIQKQIKEMIEMGLKQRPSVWFG